MKYFLIILIALTFVGCQYKVDNTDIFKVGEALHESFVTKDSSILKQIFVYGLDSISTKQKERINEISEFYTPEVTVLKSDTSSYTWGNWRMIDLYYKKSTSFFRIRAYYEKDSLGKYYINELYFNDINKLCEEDKNKPYCPKYDVAFKRISWTTDYYEKTFKSGEVFFQNNSDIDFNYIKFRVILKTGSSQWNAETFFNQTVESYKPSYSGDITSVPIPGMENYFTGFKIEKDNLFFDAELIEVLPKPESDWCIMLEKLEKEVIANSK